MALFLTNQADAQFSTVINIPGVSLGASITSDTQLNVSEGGRVTSNFDSGTPDGLSSNIEVNLIGGILDGNFNAYSGSTINILSGLVRDNFNAYSGSTINISGGYVGNGFDAYAGSLVNVSGGHIEGNFFAQPDSIVNITGGFVGENFTALEGSVINFSGGHLYSPYFRSYSGISRIYSGSQFNIYGNDFYLNRDPIIFDSPGTSSTPFDLSAGKLIAGYAANGSPFAFHPSELYFEPETLSIHQTEIVDPAPETVVIDTTSTLSYSKKNQDIIVQDGADLQTEVFQVGSGNSFILEGARSKSIDAHPHSDVSIYYGQLWGDLRTYGGNASISYSDIYGDLAVRGGGQMHIKDSNAKRILTDSYSTVIVDGGNHERILVSNSNYETPEADGSIHINSGIINGLNAFDSKVFINGGVLNSNYYGNDKIFRGEVVVSGGEINGILEVLGTDLVIEGGNIEYIRTDNWDYYNFEDRPDSLVTFKGSHLYLSNSKGLHAAGENLNVGESITFDKETVSNQTGRIFGILADGTLINKSFLHDYDIESPLKLEKTNLPYDSKKDRFTTFIENRTTFDRSTIHSHETLEVEGAIDKGVTALPGSILNLDGAYIEAGTYEDTSQLFYGFGTTITAHNSEFRRGLRLFGGSRLDFDGGTIGSTLTAVDHTEVNIYDSEIGRGFRVYENSLVNIHGGTIGSDFEVHTGSVANITDGVIDQYSRSFSGSTINISQDAYVYGVDAEVGGTVNISGGYVEHAVVYGGTEEENYLDAGVMNISGGEIDRLTLYGHSLISGSNLKQATVNISGGTVLDIGNAARDNIQFNLIGTKFLSDGYDVPGLFPGASITLSGSELITATLADGSEMFVPVRLLRGGSVTLTLLPEDFLAGDFNADGKVDSADHTVWRNHLGQDSDSLANNFHSGIVGDAEYQTWLENYGSVLAESIAMPGDYNDDGVVDAADYTVLRDHYGHDAGTLPNDPNFGKIGEAQYQTWLANYGNSLEIPIASSAAIPEPSALLLIALSIPLLAGRRL